MKFRKEFDEAAAAHRAAAGYAERARSLMDERPVDERQAAIMMQLARAAAEVTPGFLGRELSGDAADEPLGHADADEPLAVRVGRCGAGASSFPVIVNLLGTGHLALDADATDPRVRSIVRSVPLRLLAARPSESLTISFVDCATGGEAFAPFAPLVEAGMTSAVAVDEEGLSGALDAAVEQLDRAKRDGASGADLPERLLVIAGLPDKTQAGQRIARIAAEGPAARVHLVIADAAVRPRKDNAYTTHVRLTERAMAVAGVPLPVLVDDEPDPALIGGLCRRLVDSRSWVFEDGGP